MAVTLAPAGDTMLGRGVAQRLAEDPRSSLLAPEVVDAAAEADLFVVNLECCASARGERFPAPGKRFFFRAPPVAAQRLADLVVVTPHWGPNMAEAPVSHVRAAAAELEAAGATLVAGHSAHVFQGVAGRVLFDLGDFLDDYRTDAQLRSDLGLLWLVTLDESGPRRLEAVPLASTPAAHGRRAATRRRGSAGGSRTRAHGWRSATAGW